MDYRILQCHFRQKNKFFMAITIWHKIRAVDFEAAQLLYKSGCRNFGYAPESGSSEILTTIKKKVKISSLIESLKSSLKANLKPMQTL